MSEAITFEGKRYSLDRLKTYLIDVQGYSVEDCDEMDKEEVLMIINESQAQYECVEYLN